MKVSIIIRAFNRLEYTIQCINSIIYNSGYEDYEIIVVNQGSTDGTKQWLNWIKKMPNKWYDKVIPVHFRRNYGDFGGMKIGFKYSSGDIIMKLDNDIFMETRGWLDKMVKIYQYLNADILMAKRKGVKEQLPFDESKAVVIPYMKEKYRCVKIPRATACYITHRDIFELRYKNAKSDKHLTSTDNCWKCLDIIANHIEGYDPEKETYIQHDKYNFLIRKQFLSKKWIFKYGLKR